LVGLALAPAGAMPGICKPRASRSPIEVMRRCSVPLVGPPATLALRRAGEGNTGSAAPFRACAPASARRRAGEQERSGSQRAARRDHHETASDARGVNQRAEHERRTAHADVRPFYTSENTLRPDAWGLTARTSGRRRHLEKPIIEAGKAERTKREGDAAEIQKPIGDGRAQPPGGSFAGDQPGRRDGSAARRKSPRPARQRVKHKGTAGQPRARRTMKGVDEQTHPGRPPLKF